MSQTEVQLIKDAVIVNADISNSAAIDVSKISGALPVAGGTITGDVTFDGETAGRDIVFDRSDNALEFADDAILSIGTGGDLIFKHSSGENIIDGVSGNILIKHGSERHAVFAEDGQVELYYDNTNTFKTKNNGIIVLGGENNNSEIEFHADEGDDNADKWRLKADTNGQFEINNFASGSYERSIECNANGNVELYFDNTLRAATVTSGFKVHGILQTDVTSGQALSYGDNARIDLGSGDDFQFKHDGSNSLITNNTGELKIGSDHIELRNAAQNSTRLASTSAGALELYYANSKKFETTSSGVDVTGQLTIPDGSATGNRLAIGDSQDLILYHDGTHSYIYSDNGELKNRAAIWKAVNEANSEKMIEATEDGSVDLYFNGNKKFETTNTGVNITGSITVDGSAFTGGKCVKQLASFTQNAFNTTDSAFSDVISFNYTPASSSSLIVFDFTAANASVGNSSGGSATLGIRLIKDSTTLVNATNAVDFAVGNGEPDRISSSLLVRHMEGNSNTNQRTYKAQFNREAGNTNATLSNGLGIIIREFV